MSSASTDLVERIERGDFDGPKVNPSPRALEYLAGFQERMANLHRETQDRNEAWAKENGHSSWQACKDKRLEQWEASFAAYEKSLDEKCARMGITRAQLYAQDPQRGESPPRRRKPCDCQEHIGMFCPQNLMDYRSMDFPDLMGYLECRHRLQPEELQVRDDEPSRRLSEAALRRHWERAPESPPLGELSFWAKADETLLRIANGATAPCSTASDISPSPPALSGGLEHPDRSSLTTMTPPSPSSPPILPSQHSRFWSSGRPASNKARGVPVARRGRVDGGVGKPRTRRGRGRPAPSMSTRITRSHRTTKFFEMDINGHTTTLSNPPAHRAGSPRRIGKC
ncbi:MAG: hypothetical protein M1817_001356 [Caeruleum heppii]|nr:MAG: hypothetical protein M1817_001356 [Caeruleum heppii]